jgi:hypothetical protein
VVLVVAQTHPHPTIQVEVVEVLEDSAQVLEHLAVAEVQSLF